MFGFGPELTEAPPILPELAIAFSALFPFLRYIGQLGGAPVLLAILLPQKDEGMKSILLIYLSSDAKNFVDENELSRYIISGDILNLSLALVGVPGYDSVALLG